MADCSTMVKGDSYKCSDCGFEVQVTSECTSPESCSEHSDQCQLLCCGKEMAKA